jgi:L-iditol 2-dehydrogenase
MLAARAGAAQVIAIDPQDQRLTLAREAGATLALNPQRDEIPAAVRQATQGRMAEVAIVACPVPEAQEQALQLLAPFGRLCLFGGLPGGTRPVHLDTNAIHYRRLLVTGTTGGSPQDYRIALRLAASGRIALARIISDVFPWSRLAEAYRTAQNGALGKVVLLDPGLEDGR